MKKGSRHLGSIYQQAGKTGYVIRWKDAQGRRRGRLVKVTSVEQAAAALSKEKEAVEKAKTLGITLPTEDNFATFAAEFLRFQEKRISSRVVRGRLSRAEYERQKGIVVKHLVPFFGPMKLAAIRKSDVIRYIQSRIGVVSDGTTIKEVNTLKRLFFVAIDDDKISSNPAQRVPLPQAPKGRTRYLLPDEWGRVFTACYIEAAEDGDGIGQWLQQAAGLAVALGTRRGELLFTTVQDVDLAARRVFLRRTKNGETRSVYINNLARQVFDAMGIAERKRKNDRRVLFPGITPEQLSMRFIRACRLAGIEDFSLHDLRHTFASHLRMAGADLYDLQKLLGHSDPRMTQRYTHLSQEHLDSAASRLDGVLSLPSSEAS